MPLERESGVTVLHRTAAKPPRRTWRSWLIGRPLATADAEHQTIGKTVGLAVFASDALSSTAYATQEILYILAVAGTAAFALAFPISIGIVVLLAIVTVSYLQVIHAYPSGGGSYIVARDCLGEMPAQVAGGALLVDYTLTVAVSISSGVAQITSAFPALYAHRVGISIVFVLLIMTVNLRGVRESGAFFALPTYFFLLTTGVTVVHGLVRSFFGTLPPVSHPPLHEVAAEAQAVSLFLILHAFSSGTTALTGVEAISNGIQAFKEPKSRNAGITLAWLAGILGALFLGITYLTVRVQAIPSDYETVISQVTRTVLGGRGPLYLATLASTTLILVLAANTAFNGFPRLSAIQAADGFLPRQLTYRGSRLVFSRGILLLSLMACGLIALFKARVTSLIPLYAIGVFLCFTLSQLGMARRWWLVGRLKPGETGRTRGGTEIPHDRAWIAKCAVNGIGAVLTAVVTLVFAVTKFREGAWIVVILLPLLVALFYSIHRHYLDLGGRLSLDDYGPPPRIGRHRVIIAVSGVHRGTLEALRYAKTLGSDITAVHVSMDREEAEVVRRKWEVWGQGVRLVILDSPYRLLLEPLLEYIEDIAARRQPNETITILVPQFVPSRKWQNLLHTQTAMLLRFLLVFRKGIVITDVPYHLEARAAAGQEAP